MCRRTAWRTCSTNGRTVSIAARGRGRHCKPGPPVHDDLVERDFTADAPNRLWLTDITEHRTGEGKLYLCAIKDVYSGRIVGYSMDSRMKSRLARSEEHTSELQSRGHLVCRLLLEKKKRIATPITATTII